MVAFIAEVQSRYHRSSDLLLVSSVAAAQEAHAGLLLLKAAPLSFLFVPCHVSCAMCHVGVNCLHFEMAVLLCMECVQRKAAQYLTA